MLKVENTYSDTKSDVNYKKTGERCSHPQNYVSRLALKIVVMTRELLTGNREQGRGFGQLYFSLLLTSLNP